ncbi:MAG TPA: hypothetical protein ENJ93_08615 [Chloroflexi bacterium]|nr:hypothetical protein [Chloroflexota bacterium]
MMRRFVLWSGVLLLAVIMLAAITVFAAPYMPTLKDFAQTFYPAVRYTLSGQNPYTGYYEITDQGAPPAFFSPAWFLLILLPFGLFPLPEAQVLWGIFLIGVTLAAVWRLRAWGVSGAWTPLLLLLPWSLISILFGQPTAVVLLGALEAIIQVYQRPQTRRSGFILLLAFLLLGIKPQLGLLIAVPLLLQMVWQRDRRLWIVGIGGVIIVGGTLWLTFPYLLDLADDVQKIAPHWQSTLERELLLRQGPMWLATAVRLFVVGMMGWWAYRAKGLTFSWWAGWLTAVLILTPYTRAYDNVLMLPLLAQMIAFRRWCFLIFVGLLVLYLFTPHGELGSVVAPLTAWLLFVPWRSLATGQWQEWRLTNDQSPMVNR